MVNPFRIVRKLVRLQPRFWSLRRSGAGYSLRCLLASWKRPRRFLHRIEAPRQWEDAGLAIEVRGWCLLRSGEPLAGVRAVVGATIYDGWHGEPREDVLRRLELPRFPVGCGYRIRMPVPRRNAVVRLQALLPNGEWHRFSTQRLVVWRVTAWRETARAKIESTRFRRMARAATRGGGDAPENRRVLLVSHELRCTGAPIMLLHLATALKARGYHVHVVCPSPGPLRKDYRRLGIPVFIMPGFLEASAANFERLRCFGAIVANTTLMHRCVSQAAAAGIPLVWYIQEGEAGRSTMLVDGEARRAFRKATAVVFPSRKTAGLYSDFFPHKGEIIPNGLPVIPRESPSGVPSDPPGVADGFTRPVRFLQLGTISHRKGQDVLIAAIRALPESERARARFDIVGNPQNSAYFEDCLREAGELPGVSWSPGTSHEGALDAIRRTDVLVVASRDEALPVVVQEAMCLGKAVIASDAGGVDECIEDGVSGLIVARGDASALAAALRRTIAERDLRARLGAAAQRVFHERFALDRMADQFEDVMRQARERMRRDGSPGRPDPVETLMLPSHSLDDVIRHEDWTERYRSWGNVFQGSRAPAMAERLDALGRAAGLAPGMRVLDAGCGIGGPAIHFARHFGVTVEALTLSPRGAGLSRQEVAKEALSDRITVREGDYHRLPENYDAESFDRVIFLESLGHVKDLRAVFVGSHRVLKPGGRLYLKEIFANDCRHDYRASLLQAEYLRPIHELYKIVIRPLYMVVDAIEAAGFEIFFCRKPDFRADIDAFFTFLDAHALPTPRETPVEMMDCFEIVAEKSR